MTHNPTPLEVENIVMARTSNAQSHAFWLWLLLGGINAHIAYLNPKYRWPILIASILGLILTGGLSGLVWLFNWIWLGQGRLDKYRRQIQAQVETDLLRQRHLSGEGPSPA